MSDNSERSEDLRDPSLEGHDEEFVPEDDAIIGVAMRRSLLVIVALAAVAATVVFAFKRPAPQAPEQSIDAAAPETVQSGEASVPALPFADVTAEAGIDFVHSTGGYGDKLLPETMGGGVAFFDADGDDDPDLLFVDSGGWAHHSYAEAMPPTLRLYRNDTAPGGPIAFVEITAESGLDAVSAYGMGVAVADYDGDGDRDLFLTAVGENKLLRNEQVERGSLRFTDVTAAAGVAGDAGEWSTGAGFFDADNDGDLDLFVCNYVRWSKEIDFELDFKLTGVGRAFGPPQSYQGTHPYLYRNDGGGTFTDVSAEAGVQVANPATGVPMAKALALLPIDVDQDGWLDVLVANDTVQNFLFRNLGGERGGELAFAEEGEIFGVAYDRNGNATGAMGIDAAHYRNDPNLAFLIGNFANEMSSAYVAQDDPTFFVDESITEGIGAPSRLALTFGLFLFDADLDGRLDLLQANGHIEDEIGKVDPSQAYRQSAQLFWNGADAGFIEAPVETLGALGREIVGRGAAFADLDADGDLDVVLTQVGGPPLLLRNDQALDHHWLRVRLVGEDGNRDGIGAWVELEAGGVIQKRQVMPTRSYLSQVQPAVTFGLGDTEQVDALRVRWPDGAEQEVEVGAEVDRVVVVERAG